MGGHPACPQVLFGNKRRKHIKAQLAGKLDNQSRFTINQVHLQQVHKEHRGRANPGSLEAGC